MTGRAAYHQVVEMYNDADTPMRFQFDADPLGIFKVKPDNGLIMPRQCQLVAFRFWPREAQRYSYVLASICADMPISYNVRILSTRTRMYIHPSPRAHTGTSMPSCAR